MSPTPSSREERYNEASPTVQHMYNSSDAGQILWDTARRNYIPDSHYSAYAILVGDIILGFYPKSELKRLLIDSLGIREGVAQSIEHDLASFLAPIADAPSVPEAPRDQRERLVLRPVSAVSVAPQPVPTQTAIPAGSQRPLTREEVLSALSPKRTMANDIQSLQEKTDPPMRGYGSIQSGK